MLCELGRLWLLFKMQLLLLHEEKGEEPVLRWEKPSPDAAAGAQFVCARNTLDKFLFPLLPWSRWYTAWIIGISVWIYSQIYGHVCFVFHLKCIYLKWSTLSREQPPRPRWRCCNIASARSCPRPRGAENAAEQNRRNRARRICAHFSIPDHPQHVYERAFSLLFF